MSLMKTSNTASPPPGFITEIIRFSCSWCGCQIIVMIRQSSQDDNHNHHHHHHHHHISNDNLLVIQKWKTERSNQACATHR